MSSFTIKLQKALDSGLLLRLLETERTLGSICTALGYSTHGRNTGTLTVFLASNNIEFKNHSQKTKEMEARKCVQCGNEFLYQ